MSGMERTVRQGALTLKSVNEDFEMKIGPLNLAPVDGFGKASAKGLFAEDAKYYARKQFDLEKDAEGHWWVVPNEEAANATFCNWERVTERTRITTGGILAVGSKDPEKNVVKGVMEVEIEGEERVDVPREPPAAPVAGTDAPVDAPVKEPPPSPEPEVPETAEEPSAGEVAPEVPAESAEPPEETPTAAELEPETAEAVVPEVKGGAGEDDVGELLG